VISSVRFYREGLGQLLAACDGVEVWATLSADSDATARVLRERPDVVLVDVSSHEGVCVLRRFGECAPELRTVALAVGESPADILDCARAGAAGYVSADASLMDLLLVVRSVMQGELHCPPSVATVIRRQLACGPELFAGSAALSHLTIREMEILELLSQRLGNKEIARRLNIELSTVKTHVHNILEKMHVKRRAEVALRPFQRRLVGLGPDGV
jgi:DNA-binding NarL/FixJ family response regulator